VGVGARIVGAVLGGVEGDSGWERPWSPGEVSEELLDGSHNAVENQLPSVPTIRKNDG